MENITLYFREGSSDKIYQAAIEPKDGGCVVTFAYGRRGSTLSTGTKTQSPVSHDEAKAIYDKLVKLLGICFHARRTGDGENRERRRGVRGSAAPWPTGCRLKDISTGRCSTTSNGPKATTSASAWFISITRRSGGRRRTPSTGIARSSAAAEGRFRRKQKTRLLAEPGFQEV